LHAARENKQGNGRKKNIFYFLLYHICIRSHFEIILTIKVFPAQINYYACFAFAISRFLMKKNDELFSRFGKIILLGGKDYAIVKK
jgi:hypothetical protein